MGHTGVPFCVDLLCTVLVLNAGPLIHEGLAVPSSFSPSLNGVDDNGFSDRSEIFVIVVSAQAPTLAKAARALVAFPAATVWG